MEIAVFDYHRIHPAVTADMHDRIAFLDPSVELASIQDHLLALSVICGNDDLRITAEVTEVPAIELHIDKLGACARFQTNWHFRHDDYLRSFFRHNGYVLARKSKIIAVGLDVCTRRHDDDVSGSSTTQSLTKRVRCAGIDIDHRCVRCPCHQQGKAYRK